jgi:hypothetical protein
MDKKLLLAGLGSIGLGILLFLLLKPAKQPTPPPPPPPAPPPTEGIGIKYVVISQGPPYIIVD